MAWHLKDKDWLFPRHKGEFCGNFSPAFFHSQRHDCYAGNRHPSCVGDMISAYLKESKESLPWEESCLTPPSMMEPRFEYLYNINGVPGLVEDMNYEI